MGLEAGAQVGPYRIKGPLGRGGMAAVYSAYEASLDRDIALKVLPAEFLHDPSFAERFNREARVIARLEHPNIIPIYAFGIDEARRLPWMAMRLIPGGALSSLLKRGRLPYDRVLAILHGVAEALGYAHEHGVVHRDVKPQNVLLDQAERVYLADFGIAKMLESGGGLTQTGMITGTPQYMAPEQATATTVDHRADIYAVGIVAYEMFTGRVPFAADTPVAVLMKQVSEPLPRPTPEEVPEGVVEAILRCTAKRPDDRWPTTRQFVRALEDALAYPTARVGPSASQAITAPMPIDQRPTLQSASTAEAQPGWEATAVSPRTARGAALASTHPGSRTATAPGLDAASSAPTSMARRSGASPALVMGAVIGGAALLLIAVAIGALVWLRRGDTTQPVASESPRMVQVSPPPAPGEPTPPAATLPPATQPPVSQPDVTRPSGPRVPPATTPSRPETTMAPRPPETQAPRPLETPPPAAPAGPSSEVRELLAQLRQGGRDERVQAALKLGDLRREPAFAVPALAEALRDRNEDLRLRAAEALGKFGADARPAVEALVAALDGSDLVAAEAAKSLGKLGAAAAAAASPLAGALSRSDVGLRREAARALARLGPLASATVGELAEALVRDRDKVVRQQVADALGAIGPPARDAVPALRQASADKDGILARKARAALEKIGGGEP